jgi:hypothetical protein
VAGDYFGFMKVHVKEPAGLFGNEPVACPMESVLADPVLLVVLVWDGIHESVIWHSLVERGIEDRHLRYSRQQFLA